MTTDNDITGPVDAYSAGKSEGFADGLVVGVVLTIVVMWIFGAFA